MFFRSNANTRPDDNFESTEFQVSSLRGGPMQVVLIAPALVAWGLQRLMQTAASRILLAGTFDGIDEALPMLDRNPPDLIVLDLDDGYGVADVARLYEQIRVNILVLTTRAEPAFMEEVLAAGARGLLRKNETPSALLRAIDAAGTGQLFATQADTESMFVAAARKSAEESAAPSGERASRISALTSRELQTIAAVTSEVSAPVKVIADRLCISEHTLRNHLTSIYSKLGVSGRLGLYAYASQHNLQRFSTAAGR